MQPDQPAHHHGGLFFLERYMPNQTPIPTQINIAPSGMTWKNWKLVQGTDGFPTRETMEKYLCNPDRVRDLEECRDLNLQTIKQLEALIQLYEAQMEAIGAGGVEPLRKQTQLAEVQQGVPSDAEIGQAIDGFDWEGWIDQRKALRTFVKECLQRFKTTHPTQQGLAPIEQRQLAIGHAVERACKELPEGAGITISLERGAGMVEMVDWDGNEFDHFDEEHEDFADCINAAIDGAIAAEQFAAQAKQGGAA